MQHALWNFDKGGFLQDLLHQLKYHRLTGVGVDLGMALGRNVAKNPNFAIDTKMVLVPVPLHPRKKRIRGFNQARYIAEGAKHVLDIPLVNSMDVVRIKNTKTQTGFTLEKRHKNVNRAFSVLNEDAIKERSCIIVDDVFTTGATAFELSRELLAAGAHKTLIITVAQA